MITRCLEAMVELTIVLTLFMGVCATGSDLEEQWNRSIPNFCWSLSVSDNGTVAALEVDKTETVLGIYSVDGTVIKRWSPPKGKQFEYAAIDGTYVVAWYGYGVVVLFGDEGREQLWAKSAEDIWPTSVSLSAASGRVTFADYSATEKSTVWCYTVAGEMVWKNTVPSLVTDISTSASGNVVVAGEKYGLWGDEGVNAVYLFSPSGTEMWRVKTESPVIDVHVSPQAEYVVAGLDNGGMLLLDKTGQILMSRDDVGAWVDIAAAAHRIVASSLSGGITCLGFSGDILWRGPDNTYFLGDQGNLFISEDGSITATLYSTGIDPDNAVYIFNLMGEVLYKQMDSSTTPRVAVSPNGGYVSVAFGGCLRLFKASE
ncbi:PQQ-binding-like beta-propeller repeat protein [Candidatus Bipolaricaulota bacterium]|nr:PQQ-binding-like beta-propeller repeat protein [Candidatus Bipolaricaulota bacterium]